MSAHPVVFSHLLPSHTWQATCLNCGEKCESDSQVALYCCVTERRRKFMYNPHVRQTGYCMYSGADKFLARPTSRCILFDSENISFDASLVIYINSTNIPPIMIINRIYEHQKPSVAVACFLHGRAKDLSAPLIYMYIYK